MITIAHNDLNWLVQKWLTAHLSHVPNVPQEKKSSNEILGDALTRHAVLWIRQAHCWATVGYTPLTSHRSWGEPNPFKQWLFNWFCLEIPLFGSPWLVFWNMNGLFFHVLGMRSPTDSYFSEELKPPTSSASTLNHWPLAVTLLTPFVCWGPTYHQFLFPSCWWNSMFSG